MLRRRTPETDQLDVELVEVVGDDAISSGPVPVPRDAAAGRGPRRRRRLLVAGVAVALVAVLGAAQLLELGRSPTAGVTDGLIGAVPTAPEQLWLAPGSHWSFVEGDTVVHGSGRGVTMRDVRTGDVVGEREDVGQCEPATDGSMTGQVRPVVLCQRGPFLEDGVSVMVLTALAAADGGTLWNHTVETSRWSTMLSVLDGDVGESDDDRGDRGPGADAVTDDDAADVLWAAQDDGTVRVVRLSLLDGTVRWSTEHESRADGLWFQELDGLLIVTDSLVLDLATGEDSGLDPSSAPWTQEIEVPVPRGVARATWTDGGGTLTVVAPDGTERFTLDGAIPLAWSALVSERADVVAALLEDQRAVVLDALTGEELWELAGGQGLVDQNVVAYLPETVIVTAGTDLRAYAARTGATLWSTEEQVASWTRRVVDDRRLVTPTLVDGEPGLRALDLETGETAWQVSLPSRVQDYRGGLHAADGVLVVQMESGTVAFATG